MEINGEDIKIYFDKINKISSVLNNTYIQRDRELIAAGQKHRRKISKSIKTYDSKMVDMEETEVGRVRLKLKKLMSKSNISTNFENTAVRLVMITNNNKSECDDNDHAVLIIMVIM